MTERTHVAIVGAGPYGLSIAAHLRAARREFRIFGTPMSTWCNHMPDGMLLKSDGFASNLSDPAAEFTLQHFCESIGNPYHHTTMPVSVETFRSYGRAFQERMVPELEHMQVVKAERDGRGYRLHLSDGSAALADNVVLAVGITHFHNMPASLAHLPNERVSHSSAHREPARFAGRDVTIIGGGASAIDLAVLLKEAGANVTLVARRTALRFSDPPSSEGPTLWEQMRHPSSPVGPGWRSRIYSDAPWLVHLIPETRRLEIVRKHLGPAAGWAMKPRFIGKVSALLGHDLKDAQVKGDRLRLTLWSATGTTSHTTEHLIAATGYQVDLRRLPFLQDNLLSRIRAVNHTPVLSSRMESSLPGVFFVGLASANSFGPVMRFACGADWAARRIARNFASLPQRTPRQVGRSTKAARQSPKSAFDQS